MPPPPSSKRRHYVYIGRLLRWGPVVLSLVILWLCFPTLHSSDRQHPPAIVRRDGEGHHDTVGDGVLDTVRGVGVGIVTRTQRSNMAEVVRRRLPHQVRGPVGSVDAIHALLHRVLGAQYATALLRRLRVSIDAEVSKQDWCTQHPLRRAPADCVLVVSERATLDLNASSGIGATWAVHHLLKVLFRTSVSWGAERHGLNMDETLLQRLLDDDFAWEVHAAKAKMPFAYSMHAPSGSFRWQLVAPAPRRYMYNVCTFGYTTAFYGWAEWEREIDWLALHGVNLPLALIGQEAVWMRLWKRLYNVSDVDIFSHFTGPAFWPWHWMGNLRGWAGPITHEYVEQRRLLQHQILGRMRSLGMSPVLQAFGGHVPEAVATVLTTLAEKSNGRWTAPRQSVNWMGFRGQYTGVYMLDPTDPAFVEIGSAFIKDMKAEYGAVEYYNADTFNEMLPPTMDPEYLYSSGAAVLKGIQGGDPDGKWLVQGWLFLHHRHIWTREAVKAYLDGAGVGNVMVLDLASDIMAMWPRHDAYYGHDFVWCMLHSFGGRRGIFGNLPDLMDKLQYAYFNAGPGLVGVGMSMEATHHNPAMYEALSDVFFVDASLGPRRAVSTPPSADFFFILPPSHHGGEGKQEAPTTTQAWAKHYVNYRYGQLHADDPSTTHLHATFGLLLQPNGAYAHRVTCCPTWTLMAMTPTLDLQSTSLDIDYDPDNFVVAARHMVQAVVKSKEAIGPGLRYDAVDFLRQGIENLFTEFAIMILEVSRSYRSIAGFQASGERAKPMMQLLKAIESAVEPMFGDLDTLLSFEADLDSGSWFSAAVRGATSDGLDVDKMLFNAKNLVTAWGDSNGQGYPNYAAKSWSGLYQRLYQKRWKVFFDSLVTAMSMGKYALDQDYETSGVVAQVDWQFCINHTAADRSTKAPSNADKSTPALRATIEALSAKWLGEGDLEAVLRGHQFGSQIRARSVAGKVPTQFVLCQGAPPASALLYTHKIVWSKSLATRVVMCDALGDICGGVSGRGDLFGPIDEVTVKTQCSGAVRVGNGTSPNFFLLRSRHSM